MSDFYLGEIVLWGFYWPPRGFSLCQGQLVAISSNNALFALLGTNFGGDGRSTFGLPDMRGRFPLGQGQSQVSGTVYNVGQHGGVENTALGIANIPAHIHTANYTAPTFTAPTYTAPTAVTTINAYTAPTGRQVSPSGGVLTGGQDNVTSAAVSNYATGGGAATLGAGAATTVLSGGGLSGGGLSGGGVTINPTGANQAFSVLNPYLALNYSICVAGIFPSRN